tara:strand:- start:466 stop:705 length:240 start_codon:yes stop_codon:yes gene_type:complete
MVFKCYLCSENSVYLSFFCEPCTETRRILQVYGAEETRNIIKRVCVRDNAQRSYKISSELKKEIQTHKAAGNKKEMKNI